MEYFYEQEGEQIGPINKAELQSMIDERKLSRDSLIWCNAYKDWTKISETDFNSQSLKPPPLSGKAINNTYIWVLALTPLILWYASTLITANFIGEVLGWFYKNDFLTYKSLLSFANFYDNHHTAIQVVLTYIIYTVIAIVDEIKLEDAGYNTDKISGWKWLVPVYIYTRCNATKINLAPFIVWIATFLTTIILETKF